MNFFGILHVAMLLTGHFCCLLCKFTLKSNELENGTGDQNCMTLILNE